MAFRIKGINQTKRNFGTLKSEMAGALDDALRETGDKVLELSESEVPFDKGILLASRANEKIGGKRYVGYHTPYARRLHEHPEYNFQQGRKGKYLYDPVMRNNTQLVEFFSKKVEKRTIDISKKFIF